MKYPFLILTLFLSTLTFISCDDDDNTEDMGANVTASGMLYASNNSDGDITVYDVEEEEPESESQTIVTSSTAAEGIYFDGDNEVVQASRSSNNLNAYADISASIGGLSLTASFSSASDLSSPRDLAVSGNFYVVADNADVDGDTNTADGRLFIYSRTGDSFTLRNTITTDFAVWGIEFVGSDLYAVVDKTNRIAVYTNFLANNSTDASRSADKEIQIEGIVRTHGLAFDGGTMVLTDVGDAGSDSDGAFHVITNWETKFNNTADNDVLVISGNQVRVDGSATFMGNPVAAEYDAESNTVFIAEAANGGGRVLSFTNIEAGGNLSPELNANLESASSLYYFDN